MNAQVIHIDDFVQQTALKQRLAVSALITDCKLIINADAVSPAAAHTLLSSIAIVEEAFGIKAYDRQLDAVSDAMEER